MSEIGARALRSGREPRTAVACEFSPYWVDSPYQPLLASALSQCGVEVIPAPAKPEEAKLGSAAQQGRADLLHIHWLPLAGPHPTRTLRGLHFLRRLAELKRRGIPIVWTAHNLVPHESKFVWFDLWLSRAVAQLADCVICHSEGARNELISTIRVEPASKFHVIPHGNFIGYYPNDLTVAECRRRLSLPFSATVFLTIGHIRAYKGISALLDTFRRLPDPAAKLVIAGQPYDPHIDSDIRARAESDARVLYVPRYVADADVQVYMNAADAVVFPYRRSLTSGGLILAMSYGRACIASRLPTMVDCLGNRGGIFYEADETDGLLGALSTAAAQRERLREMGEGNFERAKRWDWASVASATAACYREAIAATARRHGKRLRRDPA